MVGPNETMRRTPHPEPDMAEHPTAEETLMRLAQSRVATHMLRFSDAVIEAANMDDEVAALEQLSELVEGPIYRLSPLTYAFALTDGADTLGAALAERLGGCEAPEVTALPTSPAPEELPAPRRDALTMMGALAAPHGPLGAGGRVVIDARFAAAAAEATAERIDALVRDLESRLAALPAPEDHAARLDRIEARLEALAEFGAAPIAGDADRLSRIEAALESLAARAAAPSEVDARLERIEAALSGLDGLAVDIRAVGEARGLESALVEELRAVAARPVANIDLHAEREGLSRLSTALQTMLSRMDAEITRLVDAQTAGPATAPAETDPAVLERLDALSSAVAALGEVRGSDAEPLDDLVAQLRAIAERPIANIDFHVEREGLSRLSTALQTMLSRMDAEITRLVDAQTATPATAPAEADPAVLERLDALSSAVAALGEARGADAEPLDDLVAQLRAIAERPIANIDFHVEREGLSRLSTALQTMLSRMDAEITRLIEAQTASPTASAIAAPTEADPAILDRLDALSEVVALLAQGRDVERDETESLVARMREIAERPVANIDLVVEREGLTRLSAALQTMLSRMDAEITRLVEAAQGDAGGKLDAVADLARRAAEAAEAARPDGLRDEFAALAGEVRALAEKSGGGDLRRERESLMRLAFSLQTAVSRLDGEVTRLIEAGLGGGDGDGAVLARIEALAEAVAPLGRSLSEIESASALGADHAGALVDLVQAVREDLAELHGLHGRYFEALDQSGGLGAGEDLMERISATLAEFLARMERFETQRIGGGGPRTAVGLGGRLGRTP
jgi:hypothetical protein